ncbi:hypothetical protein EW026_g8006 [Hermanssonia centrifuga]|uniref:Uncharacterized protein n=1 Tax=Hermanssonia centrifuga TaxID=98765 RepID=A0A4S4K5Y9_9APHY|nr:hypothetical protein EW026_g8006 [Hermanssonia centrifuga]
MIANSAEQAALADATTPSSSKKKTKAKEISEPTELDEFGLTQVTSTRAPDSIPILHNNMRMLASQVLGLRESLEHVCADLQTTVHCALNSIPAAASSHLAEARPQDSTETLQQILATIANLQGLRDDFRTLEVTQVQVVSLLHDRITANEEHHRQLVDTVRSL